MKRLFCTAVACLAGAALAGSAAEPAGRRGTTHHATGHGAITATHAGHTPAGGTSHAAQTLANGTPAHGTPHVPHGATRSAVGGAPTHSAVPAHAAYGWNNFNPTGSYPTGGYAMGTDSPNGLAEFLAMTAAAHRRSHLQPRSNALYVDGYGTPGTGTSVTFSPALRDALIEAITLREQSGTRRPGSSGATERQAGVAAAIAAAKAKYGFPNGTGSTTTDGTPLPLPANGRSILAPFLTAVEAAAKTTGTPPASVAGATTVSPATTSGAGATARKAELSAVVAAALAEASGRAARGTPTSSGTGGE